MKVLLLGGSGSIGSAILAALVARGHAVTALARSAESGARVSKAGALPLPGDIRFPERWADAVADVDAVIHAAATFDAAMGEVDRALIDALCDRLEAKATPTRFLYTGGCWLFGETGDRIADEESPFDPLPDFAWMVPTLRRLLEHPQLEGIVIHPAMVYDRQGGVFAGFTEDARAGGPVRVAGSKAVRWPLVHRDDLAELYALALDRGRAGTAYNGAAIEGLAVGRIARAIARRHGIAESPVVIPVAQIVAERGEWARGYGLDQQMSGSRARAELGWAPSHLDPLD